jgi:hypothetical protein
VLLHRNHLLDYGTERGVANMEAGRGYFEVAEGRGENKNIALLKV